VNVSSGADSLGKFQRKHRKTFVVLVLLVVLVHVVVGYICHKQITESVTHMICAVILCIHYNAC